MGVPMAEGKGRYGTGDVEMAGEALGGTSGESKNNLDDLITSAIKGEAEKRGVWYEETSSESAVQRTTWGQVKAKFIEF